MEAKITNASFLNFSGIGVREDISKKSLFLLSNVQRGGGVVPQESKSFEVVLLSHILITFWTLNGGRGVDHIFKDLRQFLPKYWKFWAFQKLPRGCPKWSKTKETSQCPKRGGGQSHFWTISKGKVLFSYVLSN